MRESQCVPAQTRTRIFIQISLPFVLEQSSFEIFHARLYVVFQNNSSKMHINCNTMKIQGVLVSVLEQEGDCLLLSNASLFYYFPFQKESWPQGSTKLAIVLSVLPNYWDHGQASPSRLSFLLSLDTGMLSSVPCMVV